ncbi:MAG: metallophosphoesterase [Clostridia bacterium]|nr:metallophosphoesterase [Clostridia bacterium]
MQINHITVRSSKITAPLTLALCPDFHNGDAELVLGACQGTDAILIAGDLVDRHDKRTNGYDHAVEFLRRAPDVAPTFYSVGNHERRFPLLSEYWPHAENSRVTILDDNWVDFRGIVLGGLSSRETVNAAWLQDMAAQKGFKLLLCHHPEYFSRHVLPHDIDLTLSGHAHGGQVRIGSQGLYAPGQGVLPRLTSGFYHDGRLLVSRGLTNATWAPRINCGCELIILHLKGASHA